MNDRWFQTHQLRNISDDYCATLQCYQYAPEDGIHYPNFDFKSQKVLDGFHPGSDLSYENMKENVMQEWTTSLLARENLRLQEITENCPKIQKLEPDNTSLKNHIRNVKKKNKCFNTVNKTCGPIVGVVGAVIGGLFAFCGPICAPCF